VEHRPAELRHIAVTPDVRAGGRKECEPSFATAPSTLGIRDETHPNPDRPRGCVASPPPLAL